MILPKLMAFGKKHTSSEWPSILTSEVLQSLLRLTRLALANCSQTDLADNRLMRMLQRLETHKYILRNEMRSLLYDYELAHGMVGPSSSIYQKVRAGKVLSLAFARAFSSRGLQKATAMCTFKMLKIAMRAGVTVVWLITQTLF
jgi:hypothetical protein